MKNMETSEEFYLNKLTQLEIFIARRFDEISMEINATSQLVSMAEDGVENRFAEMLTSLQSIAWHADGTSPANTGVELDSIIKVTEDAANTIMDSADVIEKTLDQLLINNPKIRETTFYKTITEHLQNIVLACSFQDITSQRVTKTLEGLHSMEEMLEDTLGKIGITIPEKHKLEAEIPSSLNGLVSSQADIDSLFD
jgi:chemotaxis regulatin CheY-phosphate phosphatase CheZ